MPQCLAIELQSRRRVLNRKDDVIKFEHEGISPGAILLGRAYTTQARESETGIDFANAQS